MRAWVGMAALLLAEQQRQAEEAEQQRLREEAAAKGVPTVIWSYPRGESLDKEGETAADISSYAAQIAALLGAHIIKVKLSTNHLSLPEAKTVYEKTR